MIAKKLESYAKYGGVAAVCFEWLAVLFFYLLQPSAFKGEHPISYFASLPQTRLIFSVCFCLAALSFWIFTQYHLKKYYKVPVKLFTLSMLGFAALALVPFDPTSSMSTAIHGVLAQLFSLTFLIGMFLTTRSNDSSFRRTSIALAVIGILFLFSFLGLPKDSSLILIFEAAAGLTCQLWILWMTWHSYRKVTERAS